MKNIFLFSLLCLFVSCTAQKTAIAKKNNTEDLIGFITKNSFNQAPYNTWFTKRYENYTPNPKVILSLKKELKDVKIKGFMGTWCGDSKREIPHFYKILEQTDYNLNNLELIAVNRSKKTPNNLQKEFTIIRVPTFIFYKDGKEIGRYVEYARKNLEKDMLAIISGKPYKHAYEK